MYVHQTTCKKTLVWYLFFKTKAILKLYVFQGRRPGNDKRYKTIGESILLGAAAVAATADHYNKNAVLLRSGSTNRSNGNMLNFEPNNSRVITNQLHDDPKVGLAQCLESTCKR